MFNLKQTSINSVWIGNSKVIHDNRGEFYRVFCEGSLSEILGSRRIKQINHSKSNMLGSIRGLHYQIGNFSEMKIIRCVKGRVYDVAVDLRKASKTFLKYTSVTLCPKKNNFIVIPEGFAHGFQTLTDDCELIYLHTENYKPEYERSIHHNEPRIGISWPKEITGVSEKDASVEFLSNDFLAE